MTRGAWAIALAAFLTFAVTGGGRIVGSDEVTMFSLARAMIHGGIAVPEGATLQGPDGRFYSKNTAGQAVLALPLVAIGDAAAATAGFADERRELAARFVASFFNAVVAALLLAALFEALRRMRVRVGAAFAATVLCGFTTPFWVYAKSFMAEPLEALGLLLALTGAARAGAAAAPADVRHGERTAALGAFLAISAKLGVAPLALACLGAAGVERPRVWLWPLAGVALALAGHALYNAARFGTPFETGYGAQASASAFTTPLLVGRVRTAAVVGQGRRVVRARRSCSHRGAWRRWCDRVSIPMRRVAATTCAARAWRSWPHGRSACSCMAASSTGWGRFVGPALPGAAAAARVPRGRLRARWRVASASPPRRGARGRGARRHARWRRHPLRRRDARGGGLPVHARARRSALHGGEPLEPALHADRRTLAHAVAQPRRASAR
jgi:hypothetical protein